MNISQYKKKTASVSLLSYDIDASICYLSIFFIFEREVNVTETNNTDAKIYGVSFQTTWLTAENSKCMSFRL